MNSMRIHALALATGLAFSSVVAAQGMSKDQYQSGKDGISAEYKAENEACGSLSGNAKDICKAEAAGRQKVAKADLEAKYKPSNQTSYNLRVARAEADYSVAKEKCDDSAGNVKDVCLKEAKAAQVAGKADAKSRMKTSDANNVASEKGADARKEASDAKRDADYAVAKEKCDKFAGDAKANCMNDAKARFGKT